MAQLIKCFDFVSRYDGRVSRYVNQFTRIKNKKWDRFKSQTPGADPGPFFERLYSHQLTWASSTALKQSPGIVTLKKKASLKQLLKWFGDTSLLFYHPILKIDGAEVELDLILVTPFTVWVMVYLEGEKGSVFQGQSRRQWSEVKSDSVRSLVNPLISLARSTEVVRALLNDFPDRLPIKSALLAPESFVEFADPGRGVQIVDQSLFPSWLKTIEPYRSPIKSQQIKVVEKLLIHSLTMAEMR